MRDLKAIVEELAKGKTKTAPSYDGKDSRCIESSVILGAHKDGESTVMLEMTVSHSKESKQFYAYLQVMSVKDEGIWTSKSYSLMDRKLTVRLMGVPSDRYSAKALDAAWEWKIGELLENPELLAGLNLDHNQDVDVEA